jgi:putative flippase GtrA
VTLRDTLLQPSEPILFVVAGATAAAANFLSRLAFSVVAPFEVAVTLAFFVGLTTGFALFRRFVFARAAEVPLLPAATRFVVINLCGLLLTLAVSVGALRYVLPALGVMSSREEIAHLLGIGATIATSYFAHKLWTFAP